MSLPDGTTPYDDAWDDSALLDAWDGAQKEYKKYHSMAQRGEKVPESEATASEGPMKSDFDDEVENASSEYVPTMEHGNNAPQFPFPAAAGSVPSAVLKSAQDPELKNLMMSWYFAGYYTGLYEGKQKAYAEMQENQKS